MRNGNSNLIIEPCLHSFDGIITEVNREFINLIGYKTEELLGKSLIEIGNMIRINSQILLCNISNKYSGYIFTKSLEAREVDISHSNDGGTNRKIYTFSEIPNSRLNDKLNFVEQTFLDDTSGAAIFSVPDLILLKTNQIYIDFMDSPFNKEENSIGRRVGEIVTEYAGSNSEAFYNKTLETQKTNTIKEYLFDGFARGVTYWNAVHIPVFENGKMKYIFVNANEVTEGVLGNQQKEELEVKSTSQNKLLDAIIENISDSIVVFDKNDKYVKYNKAAKELYYLPDSCELEGDHILIKKVCDIYGKKISKEDLPIAKIRNGEIIKSFDMHVEFTNNKSIDVNVSGIPIYDSQDNFLYGILYSRDITGHIPYIKRISEQSKIITEQNIQLNAVLDNMTEGVMVTDINGKFIKANKVALRMHGLSSLDEYVNSAKTIGGFEVLSLEGHPIPPIEQAVSKALGGEVFRNFEVMIRRKESDIKFIGSYGGTPIYDENGKKVMTVITTRDITERKKMEEKLISQNKLLIAVIDNICDPLTIYDKNGSSVLMNAEGRKQYPHLNTENKSNVIYKEFQYFDLDNNILHKEDLPLSRVLKGEIIRNEKIIIKHLDWTQYAEINATPMYDDENNLVSAVVSHHDITELIKNQNEIKKQQDQLLRAEKVKSEDLEKTILLKDEFFVNISHELKTPLNVIYSTAQLFNMYCSNGSLEDMRESIIKYIGSIKKNSYRLSKLINNIVDLSKIEAGFLELCLSNNNIVEVVEDIVMSVTDYSDSKGINIIFDTDIEENIIACDPEKIERIVLNLISNAVKFSDKGDEIFVDIKDKNDFIEISVKDNGIGIEENNLNMIFDRYKQVNKSLSRNSEGTGIGLSLVKSIVELHGGSIGVESEYGKGSKFTVVLPARKVLKENMLLNNKMRNRNESVNIEFSDIYS